MAIAFEDLNKALEEIAVLKTKAETAATSAAQAQDKYVAAVGRAKGLNEAVRAQIAELLGDQSGRVR